MRRSFATEANGPAELMMFLYLGKYSIGWMGSVLRDVTAKRREESRGTDFACDGIDGDGIGQGLTKGKVPFNPPPLHP